MLRSFESLALLRLLRRGSKRLNLEIVALVVLAGLANAGVLAIINAAAENASNDGKNGRMLAMFLVTIALYVYAQRYILFLSVTEVENTLGGIRVAVADRLRRTDLEALEQLGRAEIFGLVARETQNISQAASTLAMALQSMMVVAFSVAYLAILSTTAFMITVAMSALGIMLHLRRLQALSAMQAEAQQRENDYLALLTHLIEGFKEVRLRRARSDDLYRELSEVSHTVQDVKTRTGREFSAHYIFSQVMFYALLAAIVFLLPRFGSEYSSLVLKLTAAILFIIGPLGAIVSSIPAWSSANVAAQNIFDLETRLAAASAGDDKGRPEAPPPARFSRLKLTRVVFQYPERGTGSIFRVGPLDLEAHAGEILFIVGGNGSGKSTLLKTLTGLYHPHSGAITLDDTLIGQENATWYRSHFAAVFSEYHLFERLYGLYDMEPERVRELLVTMQISDKTSFEGARFTTLDLSQGQRKRLALLVAILENRPILVLDEWAADQDPSFRRYFYEELLPQLKREGRTVIAVTHDDKYFNVADRVVKMEYGEIVPAAAA